MAAHAGDEEHPPAGRTRRRELDRAKRREGTTTSAQRTDGDKAASPLVETHNGAFTASLPIEVPAFHGIEPDLTLAYSSTAGNGHLGVGWSIAGLSVIERASPGRGVPAYSGDIFLLDGEELVETPMSALGGTHATKIESYARIVRAGASWRVTLRNGTVRTYSPHETARGAFRWLLSRVEDPHGNAVARRPRCRTILQLRDARGCSLTAVCWAQPTDRW